MRVFRNSVGAVFIANTQFPVGARWSVTESGGDISIQLLDTGVFEMVRTPFSEVEDEAGFSGWADAAACVAYLTAELADFAYPGSSGLSASDIDTLAELNAIVGDATLIDTADPRLSDARTPLTHTHVAAEVTDLGTAATSNAVDFATAAQGATADTAIQPADIDTLAELNAVVTDATLIDTTDPRLSDARAPLTHTHAAADVTDLGTAATTDATDYATAAQGALADTALQVRRQLVHGSGRAYCYTNNRWVSPSATYGFNYYQWNQNGGTTPAPTVNWNGKGFMLPSGTVVKDIWIKGRSNSAEVTGVEFYVRTLNADFFNPALAIDSAAESLAVEILPATTILAYTAGNQADERAEKIPINHTMPNDGTFLMYWRPVGTITATRYLSFEYFIELEIP